MVITDSVKRRFYEKVDVNMQWTGLKHKDGYGKMKINGRHEFAHRISYTMHNGKIPEGMCVLHSCDNPSCVNPDHLHLGTHADNAKEREERKRGRMGSWLSKLTREQVLEIREKHKDGQTSRNLAAEYGIKQRTVRDVVTKRTWKHV